MMIVMVIMIVVVMEVMMMVVSMAGMIGCALVDTQIYRIVVVVLQEAIRMMMILAVTALKE